MNDNRALFDVLLAEIKQIVAARRIRSKARMVCDLLRDRVSHYDWVGFYLVDPDRPNTLVIGPFAGTPTEHVRIGFGQGICGQAAAREEAFVIQDITKETNYLSCSVHVKSEIVMPMFKDGKFIGELDIDSHTRVPFTDADREFLAQVCEIVAELF